MAGPSYAATGTWRDAQRSLSRHRRPIAALLAAAAVLLGISAARPRPVPTTSVWVAAHDLAGGTDLRPGDVRVAHFAAALVPADTLSPVRPVVGRFLAAPVRRGEPLTDERLLSPALLAADGSADALAVPVRVTDAAATAALVQAGNRVDVLSAGDPSTGSIGPTGQVVQNVEVLAMTRAASDDGAGVVIVAVTATQAAALAALPNGDQVSLALRRRVVQTAAPNG